MAARALRSVREFSDGYEGRLARALRRWDVAAEAMAEGPLTLVHSAYRPAEILIADAGDEPRVCPVDWELASIGSTLFDFANFTDGFEGDELDSLFASYRDEAARHGWHVPGGDRARFVSDCHRLYKHLTLLSHSFPRRYPLDEVESILAGFEREAAATLG
jgi:aminoglycoside phosphotransferase (APT) family kinase protein